MASQADLGTEEILDMLKRQNAKDAMPIPSNPVQLMGLDQNNTPPFPLPNGGMVGQQLEDFIKANPGPTATTGFNPNAAVEKIESDNEEETPIPRKQLLTSKLQRLAQSTISGKPTDVNDILSKLTGQQNTQLTQAQQQRNLNQLLVGLGKAGNQIGASIARTAPNNEILNDLEKQAGQPVTDLLTQQQMHGEGLKQALETYKLADEKEKNDPSSEVSKLYRNVLNKMAASSGMQLNVGDTASASSIEKAFPPVERYFQMLETAKLRQATVGSQKENQAVQQVTQTLEGARSSPDIRQAKLDRYNVSKAKGLINLYNNDPNNLPPGLVGLVATEVSKIAKGGVPDKEEFALLNPSTLKSKFANIVGKITSQPTPANVGAFLKQYEDYMNEIDSKAKKIVEDQVDRVTNVRKKALGDNYKIIRENYIKDLGGDINKEHPQDSEAIAWAKNPNSPGWTQEKAATILKLNGTQ